MLKDKAQNTFDVAKIREEFPILSTEVNGKKLVYFDNAATTQKPKRVIESIKNYYEFENANVHRGVYALSEKATTKYENARKKVAEFLNARDNSEVIFTKGTTDGINLVSTVLWRKNFFNEGDEIIISEMEHHSNIVPWQLVAEKTGAVLKVVPITDNGEIDFEDYKKLFTKKTKFVSIVHVSNTLGTVNPIKDLINIAHENEVPILIDGAQATAHFKIDVQKLDCDFYVFSGHKTFGPTGIGILYGKKEMLETLPPYQGGGEMIKKVTFEKTTYEEPPLRFEAGTPNIAGAIGLAEAIEFLSQFNRQDLEVYEKAMLDYATEKLKEVEGLKIIGTAKEKSAVISFVIENTHPYDVGTLLDTYGFALRTGHHCTQPIMTRYGLNGTVRASFSIYNTKEEIDNFVSALKKVLKILG